MISGSICIECERRLTNLYTESHKWLLQVAYKVTKNRENAEDMVSELYEWLHNKENPKLFWGDNSYNLLYCSKFIKHRFLNKTKKLNRTVLVGSYSDIKSNDIEDVSYNTEMDIKMQTAHEEIIMELKKLSATRMWPQAKIFELYWMTDDTLDEVSHKIKISKSTTFLAVKKIRKYLEEVINNPFNV
jgi:DNA-directed RNA polymerase specialized sigma24 family protein